MNTYGSDGSDGAKTRRRARPAAPKPTLSEEDERRSTYIENAKYLLITCVVWVHALDDFLATATIVNAESASVRRTKLDVMEPALPWIRALYLTLATFSMPLFTALAGFQSKSWLGNRERIRRQRLGDARARAQVDVHADRRVGVLASVVRRGVVFRRITAAMVVTRRRHVVPDRTVGVAKQRITPWGAER